MISAQQAQSWQSPTVRFATTDLTRPALRHHASIYQVEPLAVAFPRNAGKPARRSRRLAQAGISIITSRRGHRLVGRRVGRRPGHRFLAPQPANLTELDLDNRTVRSAPAWCWTSSTPSSSRTGFVSGQTSPPVRGATLGGMIAKTPPVRKTFPFMAPLLITFARWKSCWQTGASNKSARSGLPFGPNASCGKPRQTIRRGVAARFPDRLVETLARLWNGAFFAASRAISAIFLPGAKERWRRFCRRN